MHNLQHTIDKEVIARGAEGKKRGRERECEGGREKEGQRGREREKHERYATLRREKTRGESKRAKREKREKENPQKMPEEKSRQERKQDGRVNLGAAIL